MKTNILRKDPFVRLPLSRQSGLSLVELMVSMTLGLFMMAALTTLLSFQTAARDEFDKASRQIENGRYAMQILHDDIELAGYYGQLFNIPSTTYSLPTSLPDPCAGATGTNPTINLTLLRSAVPLSIQGYDAPASGVVSPLPTCMVPAPYSAVNYMGGDILVIRRTDTSLTAIGTGSASVVYMQTTGSDFRMDTGGNTATFNLTNTTSASGVVPANDFRAYLVHIYYISKCNKLKTDGTCNDTVPTLKRLELTSGAINNTTLTPPTPLVEGIENMQLDYGIDNLPAPVGDGYPDSYTTTPANVTDWSNVVAIRVNLLARNNDPTAGYSDSKTYALGGAGSVGPYNDNYKRHAYSEVVRAINLTGRRAQE